MCYIRKVILLCLYRQEKKAPKNNETSFKWRDFCENKGICLVPEKKIMCKKQLVDPLINYIIFCEVRQ